MIEHLPFTTDGAYEPDQLEAFYTELHESGDPVFYDQQTGLHVVHRYDDAWHVLNGSDPRTRQPDSAVSNQNSLSSLTPEWKLAANPLGWVGISRLVRYVTPATANATGEPHRLVKRAVADPHSPQSLGRHRTAQNYGALVTRVVNEVTDDLDRTLHAHGVADLNTTFVQPLATHVIGDAIGFSRSEQRKIQEWSDAQTALLGRQLAWGERAPAVNGLGSLAVACHRLIAERQQNPQADLASLLAAPRNRLDTTLAVSAAMNLIAAGYATTYGTLQNSVRFLLSPSGRQHWQQLDNADYTKKLVPELVRLETGLVGWKRYAADDVRLPSGEVIPAGGQIGVLIGAANRDPAFVDPHRVRLDRPHRPMPLSFGVGEHLCMGRELALLEITTALQALRSRFPDMRVVEDGTVRYDKDNLFRTIQSLPVTRVPV